MKFSLNISTIPRYFLHYSFSLHSSLAAEHLRTLIENAFIPARCTEADLFWCALGETFTPQHFSSTNDLYTMHEIFAKDLKLGFASPRFTNFFL